MTSDEEEQSLEEMKRSRQLPLMQVPLSSTLLLASQELSDTQVYEPYIRARLGTAAHFCEVVVLR